jgi:hypothetical protein
MKLFFSGILFYVIGLNPANAQRYETDMYPDSVFVRFKELDATVVFELRFIAQHISHIDDFGATLKEVRSYLDQSKTSLENPLKITLTEKADGEKQISIDRLPTPPRQLTVEQGVMTESKPMHELILTKREALIHVRFPSAEALEKLAAYDFKTISAKVKEDMADTYMGRKRVEAGMTVTSAGIENYESDFPSAEDFLIGYATTGVGLVRDQIYPEFNLSVAVAFADHFNRARHRFDFTYNNQIFTSKTENGYRSHVNSFLNLSWGVNLCFNCDRPRWTTLGVGYLVRESGDLYTGNTMKIFATTDIGSRKLNLIPELYLTDGFKKSIFGLKLNYTF